MGHWTPTGIEPMDYDNDDDESVVMEASTSARNFLTLRLPSHFETSASKGVVTILLGQGRQSFPEAMMHFPPPCFRFPRVSEKNL